MIKFNKQEIERLKADLLQQIESSVEARLDMQRLDKKPIVKQESDSSSRYILVDFKRSNQEELIRPQARGAREEVIKNLTRDINNYGKNSPDNET